MAFDSAFRRSKEDQHLEFFGDVMKAMLDLGGYEEDAACGNFVVFVFGAKTCLAANNVVQLIFMVRALQVVTSSRKHVDPCAHGRNPQELKIRLLQTAAVLF